MTTVFKLKSKQRKHYSESSSLLHDPTYLLLLASYLPYQEPIFRWTLLSRSLRDLILLKKDEICLKRELKIDTTQPKKWLMKLMKAQSQIFLFNMVTVRVTQTTDKQYLQSVSEFYSQFHTDNMRFCLELLDIDDNKPEMLGIFDYMKCFPRVTQVKCKRCQLISKRLFVRFFVTAKMIYLNNCQFKIWMQHLDVEQLVVQKTTVWGRGNVPPGYLPKIKRFQFDNSFTNYLDLVLKPFSNTTLREYVFRHSQVHKRKMLDILYSVTWFQTRHRFKYLQVIDLEGRISEGNVIVLVANMDYYKLLTTVILENGQCQFDIQFVLTQEKVVQSGLLKECKIADYNEGMKRLLSAGRCKNEKLLRKFDIRFMPKEDIQKELADEY